MLLQPHEIHIALAIALLLVGPCLGSFASAVAYRVPRGLSWIADKRNEKGAATATRSRCPHCGYQLRIIDLVPILSWISLRGRCRKCHVPVSALYPLLEIAAALCAELFLFLWGTGWYLLPLLMALPFILAQMVIIWQAPAGKEISSLSPQLITLLSGLSVLVVFLADVSWMSHLVGGALMGLFAGILFLIRKLRGAELTKSEAVCLTWLSVVIGVFLGAGLIPVFLIAAGVMGMLVTGFRIMRKAPARDGLVLGVMPSFLLILAAGPQIMSLLIL